MTEQNNGSDGEVPETNDNNKSNDPSDVLEFDDFYELLEVTEDADTDIVFQKSRELLAEYHPDISDHPNADKIYKTVNRAQNVLTDKEQRVIYDSLGHDEYISRRERGGEMSLSESAKNNNQSLSKNISNSPTQDKNNRSGQIGGSNSVEQPSNKTRSFRKRISENNGYASLTRINFGVSPEESVKKLYRQMWIGRIVMSAVFITAAVGVSVLFPTEIMELWQVIDLGTLFSVQTTVLLFTVLFGVFMGGVTGIASNRLLKPVVEEIDLEKKREMEEIERKRNRSRGLNTSVTDVNANSERESWDSPNRYSKTRDSEKDSVVSNRTNRSLSHGPKMIVAGLALSLIGALAPGSHPWMYISSIFAGEGVRANPWLAGGSEGVESVVMLVNLTVGGSILILITAGVLYSMHGVSREAWYQKYFTTTKNPVVAVWDTVFVVLLSVLMMVVLVGVQEYPNIPVLLEQGLITDVLGIGKSITSVTVAIISVVLTWFVVLVFKWKSS